MRMTYNLSKSVMKLMYQDFALFFPAYVSLCILKMINAF